jgi:hypothetical protein
MVYVKVRKFVTKQRVTEQGSCGGVFCVNIKIANQGFRVNPAASINESGRFYFVEEDQS